jgi:hypothetical protein
MERYRGPYVYLPIVCGEVVHPVAHVIHAIRALEEAGRPTTVPQVAAVLETTEGNVVRLVARAVRGKLPPRR